MPKYLVTFMNHIVETYVLEVEDEDAAWEAQASDTDGLEPAWWDCTSCEVTDVRPLPDGPLRPPGELLVVRPA